MSLLLLSYLLIFFIVIIISILVVVVVIVVIITIIVIIIVVVVYYYYYCYWNVIVRKFVAKWRLVKHYSYNDICDILFFIGLGSSLSDKISDDICDNFICWIIKRSSLISSKIFLFNELLWKIIAVAIPSQISNCF